MKKITRKFLPLLILTLIAFASCKTTPPLQGVIEPFGVIGEKADAYIYIPMKGNEELIQKAVPMAAGNDMKKAFKRINKMYSGVFYNGVSSEVRICATGNYPYKYSGSIFKRKNGWIPNKTKDSYKYYESEYADVSIPSALIACMSLGDKNRQKMDVTLEKLKNPIKPKFSKKFEALQKSNSDEIGIFITKPDFFLSQILGVHLGLPLGNIEMYLKKVKQEKKNAPVFYNCNIAIKVDNPRTGRFLQIVLGRMLKTKVIVEDSMLKVENKVIPESKIVTIIKSLYPY